MFLNKTISFLDHQLIRFVSFIKVSEFCFYGKNFFHFPSSRRIFPNEIAPLGVRGWSRGSKNLPGRAAPDPPLYVTRIGLTRFEQRCARRPSRTEGGFLSHITCPWLTIMRRMSVELSDGANLWPVFVAGVHLDASFSRLRITSSINLFLFLEQNEPFFSLLLGQSFSACLSIFYPLS